MLVPTLIMAAIALVLLVLAYQRGQGQHVAGARLAWETTLQTLPLLIFSFLVAGLVQVLLPRDLVSRWVGTESGLRGLLIGTVAGALTPGGPYVSLPVVAGLLKAGASVGTMVAFVTGWSLWAISRLPLEVGVMGWRFTVIRIVATFFFPPIAGWLAGLLAAAWRG